ncbi:MAG TPA: aminoacyl-tRNA hydrolase [Rhodothermales bacterium]|nr:aminoacyl-tRNA hydrolase [Rhodothermales bacterium]
MKVQRLIIGLGNPGADYEGTRHNIGFAVVRALAERAGIPLRQEGAHVLAGFGSFRGRSVGLVKPLTYMNRSGTAAQAMLTRFGLRPEDVIVVVDDINLPVGAVRIRQSGSAGGHNGIQDIIDRFHTDDFPRIRIGVGNNYPRGRQVQYVLERFPEEDQPVMAEAVEKASEAAITFVTEGLVTAMNRFNKKGVTS